MLLVAGAGRDHPGASPRGRARRQQAHNANAAARASALHASTSSTLLAARESFSALAFAVGRASIVPTLRQGSHQPAGLALQCLPCRSLSEKFAPPAMATACNPRSRLGGRLTCSPWPTVPVRCAVVRRSRVRWLAGPGAQYPLVHLLLVRHDRRRRRHPLARHADGKARLEAGRSERIPVGILSWAGQ